MKKYKIILLLLFVIIYLTFKYFEFQVYKKDKEIHVSDINISIINIPEKLIISIEDIIPSSHILWDIGINEILIERESLEKSNKELNSLSSHSLIIENGAKIQRRTICLNKDCWEFMGMVSVNNDTTVTLLSKNKKNNIKLFKVGDTIFDKLSIVNIKEDSMVVFDSIKDKETTLKLFDINISAYYQKNIKILKKDKDE